MSHDDFDLGPLTWVKGEIDQALASVLDLAISCREGKDAASSSRFILTHLHQVNGALDMVGLEGAKQFCQELESLAERIGKQVLPANEEVIAVFCNGVRTLSAYLEDLVNGAPDIPLHLFPALSALTSVQGKEPIDESVLFFPDTSTRAPADLPYIEMDDASLHAFFVQQRRNFQRALLNWLRDGFPEHIAEMRQIVDGITRSQRLPINKTLWWVAAATLDAIAHKASGKAGLQAIRIFRKLDQQLRHLVEGSAKPTGALMRDLLFMVAKSPSVSDRIDQVRVRFDLEHLIPGADSSASGIHQPGGESAALTALRAAIPRLKEAWTLVDESGSGELPNMLVVLHAIEPSRQVISNAPLGNLLLTILATVERLSDTPEVLTDDLSLDVAAALTLCEFALDNYAYLAKDFALQTEQLIARLRNETPEFAGVPINRTLDVATLAAVGQEIKNILKQIEVSLDIYFRNPAKHDAIESLGSPLHQVAGAFNMLELPVAASLTNACQSMIAWFTAQQSAPDLQYFVKVAESLSALSYLVDDAMHQGAVAEKSIEPFLGDLEQILKQLEVPDTQPMPLISKVLQKPRRRTKKVTDKAVDAELLEIFLIEAEEVLVSVSECLHDIQQDAQNAQALADVRRGFHTLKGSGRTVGLAALGEVAWQVEQILNNRIENKQQPGAAELGFVGEVQIAFVEWIAQLKSNGSVAVDPELWKDKVNALSGQVEPTESQAEVTPVAPETVVIGGVYTISKALFEIFLQEARQNLQLLEQATQAASAQPEVLPDATCLRAAHTISGTARTAGIAPLSELAGALERWIEAGSERPKRWSAENWTTLERVILAFRLMLDRVAALRMPKLDLSVLGLLRIDLDEHAPVTPDIVVEQGSPPTVEAPGQRLLDIFLEEANELFPLVGGELRDWRSRPSASEPPRALQRALHTLKGGARMAGEAVLGDAIHELETRVIQVLKSSPSESDFDQMFAQLDEISQWMDGFNPAAASQGGEPHAGMLFASMESTAPIVQTLRVRANVLDELVNEAGEISISRSRIEREMGMFKQSLYELTESVTRLRSYLRELEIEADSRLQSKETLLQEVGEAFDPLEFDRYTRLQELTRMMAESVNDVATTQHGLLVNLDETESALQEQMRMSRDLQQELMHIRMIPFSAISERLHRIVRQTSRELGNRVELTIAGAQVEIDRSVLEKIVAPLEHLLRNAIAHGIEPADQRSTVGKPESGRIKIGVRQEKNEIVITVNDDGAGINLSLVRARAIEKKLFKRNQKISEQALMSVIFEPGFSTSSEVTQVAGRGVGLDVVRNDISMLGGRIDVVSKKGQGSTFEIYLPATLTMSQVVLVRAGTHVFSLPAVMVEQVQQLKAATISKAYEVGDVSWSNRRYPIHYLPRLIGDDRAHPEAQRSSPIMLLRSGTFHIALHVDEILGNREIVVKRIGQQLTLVPGIVGATVMGDGKIMLIINPVQLANRAVLSAGAVHVSSTPEVVEHTVRTVMVVDDSLTMRKVLGRLLSREGYRVVTAKDGMEALQLLQEEIPDAVVLDIEMPRMDGFEFARNVRDDQLTAHLPLIVVSSRNAEKHRNMAAEIGINAYLGKPVQDEELLESLSHLLQTEAANPRAN